MSVKLLTEQHLEFLSLTEGCRSSFESPLAKMSHCWKSHVVAKISSTFSWIKLDMPGDNGLVLHYPACCDKMLITFANSLDPDQAQQNVRPDLDPNCLTLLTVFLEDLKKKKKKEKEKRKEKKMSI